MKKLRAIEYDELSDILQGYLDKGETQQAIQYCEALVEAGNPYGYMFMGFIYEEGHGKIESDYAQALFCYSKAAEQGLDMVEEIVRVEEYCKRIEQYVQTHYQSERKQHKNGAG